MTTVKKPQIKASGITNKPAKNMGAWAMPPFNSHQQNSSHGAPSKNATLVGNEMCGWNFASCIILTLSHISRMTIPTIFAKKEPNHG